jgi:hypothetical protein
LVVRYDVALLGYYETSQEECACVHGKNAICNCMDEGTVHLKKKFFFAKNNIYLTSGACTIKLFTALIYGF